MNMPEIDDVDKAILNRIQSDFPITSRPYRIIAEDLGLSEGEVLKRISLKS
jgi:DNA-binding Lrp family transcriptional regulator